MPTFDELLQPHKGSPETMISPEGATVAPRLQPHKGSPETISLNRHRFLGVLASTPQG